MIHLLPVAIQSVSPEISPDGGRLINIPSSHHCDQIWRENFYTFRALSQTPNPSLEAGFLGFLRLLRRSRLTVHFKMAIDINVGVRGCFSLCMWPFVKDNFLQTLGFN